MRLNINRISLNNWHCESYYVFRMSVCFLLFIFIMLFYLLCLIIFHNLFSSNKVVYWERWIMKMKLRFGFHKNIIIIYQVSFVKIFWVHENVKYIQYLLSNDRSKVLLKYSLHFETDIQVETLLKGFSFIWDTCLIRNIRI